MAFDDLFKSAVKQEETANIKEIKKKEGEVTKLEKEVTKPSITPEKTKEIKLEISEKKAEIKKIDTVNKELAKETKNVSANLTAELRLFVNETDSLKTYQYILTEEAGVAMNAAYNKYKRLNPKVKKGALVELAIREFLNMETKSIKEKMGVKK